MARTRNPAVHAGRRDAFIDAAQRLIQAKGYEQMSVQDVLDDLDASKGAFYHYFDSKAALLDGVVERMVRDATLAVEPVVTDPSRRATDKLVGVFLGIAAWKTERVELMMAVLHAWLSDENVIVREKFRRAVIAQLTPLLTTVIRQGVREGVFSVDSPDDTARLVVGLVLATNEHATDLFVAWYSGRLPLEVIERALAAYPEALERILGAPDGSLHWYDGDQLRAWFALIEQERTDR